MQAADHMAVKYCLDYMYCKLDPLYCSVLSAVLAAEYPTHRKVTHIILFVRTRPETA